VNILVTGGAGYFGSTLVPMLLARGHRVRVVDRLAYGGRSLLGVWAHPAFSFVRADIRDAAAVRAALDGIEAVVHLAAIVGDPACAREPELARAVNLDAATSLLDAARSLGVERFVFASTCSNYGRMADPASFVDEAAPLQPLSVYAETKVGVERAVLDGSRAGSMCSTALRFATLFGVSPRMRFDLTVNEFTMKIVTERHLLVYGEQFWRPYVHVADAARAVTRVLEAPREEVHLAVFNVGSTDQNYTKRHLLELMLPYAPDTRIEYVHTAEDPRDYRVSFAKIQETIGFRVERTVPDGIREVAELVRDGVLPDCSDASYRN
jgi:nucleoside-diphosphate-sugar epimerase